MSYCRWSSDNFNCDLYCYESDFGFETHLASGRRRVWFRLLCWLTDKRMTVVPKSAEREKVVWRNNRRLTTWMLHRLPWWVTNKKINHRLAGESFTDNTEEAMFERIRMLYCEGFNMPKRLMHMAHGITNPLLAIVLIAMLTGCTVPHDRIVSGKATVLGLEVATECGIPHLRLGLVRYFYQSIPTGTNAVFAAPYTSDVDAKLGWNPTARETFTTKEK